MNHKFRKSSLSIAILLMLLDSQNTFAIEFNDSVIINDGTTYNYNEDIKIISPTDYGLQLSGLMGGFIVASDAVTNIKTEGNAPLASAISVTHSGISHQTGNAIIMLNETHIVSARMGISTLTPDNDNYSTTITLGNNSTIESASIALNAAGNSTINIGNDAQIIGSGYGITVANVVAKNSAEINIGDRSTIFNNYSDNTAGNVIAITAFDTPFSSLTGAHINIGNNATIYTTATGNNNHAVRAGNAYNPNTSAGSGTIAIGSNANISTAGRMSYGLYSAYMNSDITLGSGSAIETTGQYSSAVRSGTLADGRYILTNEAGGTINIGEELTILTLGTNSHGLNAQFENSRIEVGNGINITTQSTNSHGVYAQDSGIITLDDNAVITARGHGIYAQDSGIVSLADNAMIITDEYGIYAQNLGSVIVEDKVVIIAKGHGVYAQDSGTVNLADNAMITAGEHGVYAQGSGAVNVTDNAVIIADKYGVYAQDGGLITLNGGRISAEDLAIYANGNGALGTTQILGNGVFHIINNIMAETNAIVNMSFKENSYFNGATNTNKTLSSGIIHFDLVKTLWNITDTSTLTSLNLQDSSIHFTQQDSSGAASFNSLTVGNLSGNGTFTLRADVVSNGVENRQTDLLRITEESSGNHTIIVVNNAAARTNGSEVLTIVESSNTTTQFTMNNKAELGGYLYDMRQNGVNWELFSSDDDSITTAADAGANFLNIGYLINYAETQTLLQRMGDLHQNGGHGDFWIRGFAGKFDSFAGGKLSHFDMTYNGVQLGVDKQISTNHPLFLGIFLGETRGNPDYRTGNGTIKSYSGGVYGTYLADSGFYLDAIVKLTRVKNEFNVTDSQNETVNGNGSTNGMSFSLETGQKFSLNLQKQGFYIEPQAQFSYGHQDSATVKTSNGLTVNLDSYDSAIGRVSTRLGYDLATGNNQVNVYLKTGIVREFKGDVNYHLNGAKEKHNFKGNWWNNGVGISAHIDKQHTFYLDFESATGNKFDQHQINGGYRYSF